MREPEAYKAALLDLLGESDPLMVLGATPETLRRDLAEVSAPLLSKRPEANEWSVEEVIGHLCDAEMVYSFRWRLVLAQDNPHLVGYDQDAWTRLARPDFESLLDTFTSLRLANVQLLRKTPDSLWDRAGRHEERGEESVRLGVSLLAGHDRAHLKQIEQTLNMVT